MSELFNVGIGIILLLCTFETVKFLILEIEVAVVVSLCAIGVSSTTLPIFVVVAVVVFDNNPVAVCFVQDKEACNYKD